MTTIYTIGHSTRTIDDFIATLRSRSVRRLVDVRQFAGSRRFPQFGRDSLINSLRDAGIDYEHDIAFGGRRDPHSDSPNTYWRNAQFRGYADHMSTPQFLSALDRLIETSAENPTAIMCAEAVPWRCHRQLIADALMVRGLHVEHLMTPEKADPHVLNPQVEVKPDGTLVYPAPAETEQSGLVE